MQIYGENLSSDRHVLILSTTQPANKITEAGTRLKLDIDTEGWDVLIYGHNAGGWNSAAVACRGVIVGVELLTILRTVGIVL